MQLFNKIISILITFSLMLKLTGCYTPQLATREDLLLAENLPGLQITTRDQKKYAFQPDSYFLQNDSIIGAGSLILENGASVEQDFERRISIHDIETIRIDQLDAIKTTFFIAGSIGIGILLGLAINSIMQGITSDVASGVSKGLNDIY